MKNNVSITIITSTLNCADDLIDTCNSIRDQAYKNLQWIVVDGGSVDGTLNIIRSNQDLITDWISEPDAGIYDAWNKACSFINGQWVLFLGAGDTFCSPNTLKLMSRYLINLSDKIDISYGNVYQVKDDKVIYSYGRVDFKKWDDYRPRLPSHQGVFHRSTVFELPKPFDDTYKVVADSKLLLQVLRQSSAVYFDIDICNMLPGGVSSRDDKILLVKNEFFRLEKELGYQIPFLNKTRYRITVLTKHLMFKIFGPKLIEIFCKLKRKFLVM